MKHRALIAIIFLIGCATGSVASQLAVPTVRAGTAPTRWESLCSDVEPEALMTELNKAGAEGWEPVSVAPHMLIGSLGTKSDTFIFCAKRALP